MRHVWVVCRVVSCVWVCVRVSCARACIQWSGMSCAVQCIYDGVCDGWDKGGWRDAQVAKMGWRFCANQSWFVSFSFFSDCVVVCFCRFCVFLSFARKWAACEAEMVRCISIALAM